VDGDEQGQPFCMAAQKNLTENLQMIESFNGATQDEN
jgi:hypothetical protein